MMIVAEAGEAMTIATSEAMKSNPLHLQMESSN